MNHHFSFKQFTVQQQFCAMKVCTDACILGAFAAAEISKINPNNILDIGAGTGLLSLMLAQKNKSKITAVEIDANAFEQCKQNFASSPWAHQLLSLHADILHTPVTTKYDCIISNPPFFENDLASNNTQKNVAKHSAALTLRKLLNVGKKWLTPQGSFYILIPFHRLQYVIDNAAQLQLYASTILLIKQTPNHPYFRAIVTLTPQTVLTQTQALLIKETDGTYSNDVIALLKDYYLYL